MSVTSGKPWWVWWNLQPVMSSSGPGGVSRSSVTGLSRARSSLCSSCLYTSHQERRTCVRSPACRATEGCRADSRENVCVGEFGLAHTGGIPGFEAHCNWHQKFPVDSRQAACQALPPCAVLRARASVIQKEQHGLVPLQRFGHLSGLDSHFSPCPSQQLFRVCLAQLSVCTPGL